MSDPGSRSGTRFRAAIFDLGNTLMEFETRPFRELNRLGAESSADALAARVPALDREAFVSCFLRQFRESVSRSEMEVHREIPLSEIFPGVLSELGIPGDGIDIEGLIEAHYAPIVEQVDLYPDAVETLQNLKARGLKLGLVSNTIWPEAFHRRDLERYEILSLFDGLVFSSTLGVAKPHPRIFQAVLEELSVAPTEAFYVGDRIEIDVVGAQGAGMAGVLKNHPLRSRTRSDISPQGVIDALSELPGWIGV